MTGADGCGPIHPLGAVVAGVVVVGVVEAGEGVVVAVVDPGVVGSGAGVFGSAGPVGGTEAGPTGWAAR